MAQSYVQETRNTPKKMIRISLSNTFKREYICFIIVLRLILKFQENGTNVWFQSTLSDEKISKSRLGSKS
jgi:hypothetical protein